MSQNYEKGITGKILNQSFLKMIEKRQNNYGDYGLFALVDIPANTLLFSYDEWIEDEKFGWETLTLEQMDQLPPEDRDHFLKYGYDIDYGKIIGTFFHENAKNHSNYMNHSCDPNMVYDTNDNIVAKRHILKGEELTIDYGNFIVNVDQNFICRCGAESCRGRITKDDWKSLIPVLGFNFPKFMHLEIEKLIRVTQISA
jgi:SET domain-containing protein